MGRRQPGRGVRQHYGRVPYFLYAGLANDAVLIGQFLTPNASHQMVGVLDGEGSLTVGRTNAILVKDQDTGYYASIAGTYAGFENGAVDSNLVYDIIEGGFEFADPPYLRVALGGTNICLQNGFASGWSTVGTPTLTVDQLGIDGSANTGARLACVGDIITDYIQYSGLTGLPAGESSMVVWVKKKASQTNDARIVFRQTGGTDVSVSVDLNTVTGALSNPLGTPSDYYSDAEEIGGEDYWRVTLSKDNQAGNTAPLPRLASGAGEECVFLAPMILTGLPAAQARFVPPILTGATAVTQDTDTYSFDTANINDYQGSLYAEVWCNGDDNILNGFLSRSSGNLNLDDGTTQVATAMSAGEWHEVGIAWSTVDAKMDLFFDGSWIGEVAYDETLLSGDLDLFRSAVYGGRMRNLRIYSDGSSAPVIPGPVGDGILLEDGDYLLAENGDYLILE